MSDEPFNLIAAKLEDAKREMEARLNTDLFADAYYPASTAPFFKPRRRLGMWAWRVRAYFGTLWDALKGRDLVERDEDDY